MVADSQYALASFCKFTFLQVSSFAYALLHHWADYGSLGRNLIGTYAGAKDVMMNKNFQGTHPLVWGTKTQKQVSCCVSGRMTAENTEQAQIRGNFLGLVVSYSL